MIPVSQSFCKHHAVLYNVFEVLNLPHLSYVLFFFCFLFSFFSLLFYDVLSTYLHGISILFFTLENYFTNCTFDWFYHTAYQAVIQLFSLLYILLCFRPSLVFQVYPFLQGVKSSLQIAFFYHFQFLVVLAFFDSFFLMTKHLIHPCSDYISLLGLAL